MIDPEQRGQDDPGPHEASAASNMGRGLLSGLFWGGAASMVALMAASLYFPLKDLSDRGVTVRTAPERPLLADPPPPPEGALIQDAAPETLATPGDEVAALDLDRPEVTTPDQLQDTPPSAPSLSEARADPPTAPVAPVGLGPEVAETVPGDATPPPADPESPAVAGRQAESGDPAQGPRALPLPAPHSDAAPAEALATLRAPPSAPSVDTGTAPLRQPLASLPPDADAAPEGKSPAPAWPMADLARQVLEQPGAAPAPPEAPQGAAPSPDVDTAAGAPPQLATSAGAPEVTRPEADVPRLALLAPADLPLPPVMPSPVAPVPGTGDARVALEAETAPVSDPVPQEVATAPAIPPGVGDGTNADDAADRRVALAVPAQELPRRLVLGEGQSFAARGPGLSGRIPRIGETPAAVTAPAAAVPEDDPAPVGALERNALDFDIPTEAPRLSVVLRATSDARAITDVLARLAAPVAVALDPTWPDAPARAAELRGAGHEVLITLTGLPDAAEPRDIDTALAAHIARLPGAMGVWLPETSPAYRDRALTRHLAEVLNDTGHGLVAPLSGLDAVGQEARVAGLPALSVARRLGGAGEGQDALQRALEQGALRAGADGSAVLMGETRTDTLMALRDWADRQEDSTLALAPVSALLLAPQL